MGFRRVFIVSSKSVLFHSTVASTGMQTIILNLNHYDWFVSKIGLYPK